MKSVKVKRCNNSCHETCCQYCKFKQQNFMMSINGLRAGITIIDIATVA